MTEFDVINRLQQLIVHGGQQAFDAVPDYLTRVIDERGWEQRTDRDGRPFRSFEAFVTAKLWHGLETTIDDLLAFCRKRPEVRARIEGEVEPAQPHGGARRSEGANADQGDNVTLNRGNASTYALKRLKRDRPDLFANVVAGRMSANAAAVQAGFRRRPSPLLQMQVAWKRATEAEREEIRAWLDEQNSPLRQSRFA